MNGADFDTWRLAKRPSGKTMRWATSTRPGTRVLELDKTLVRVRMSEGGSSPKRTIVFAADAPMVVEQYDAIFEALGGVGRVAAFEEPGFGFSFPRRGFGFSRAEYSAALVEMLEKLDAGPYVLAFPCWTAFQAIDVAAMRPDLVESLVLMQATSWPTQLAWSRGVAKAFGLALLGVPFVGDRLFGTPIVGQALAAAVEKRFVDRTTRFVVHEARRRPELVRQLRAFGNAAFERGACNCQASVFQAYFQGDFEPGPVAQRALFVWGENDRSHRRSDRKGLARYVPNAEVRTLTNTGHHLEHESPAAVCREIARFLEGPRA